MKREPVVDYREFRLSRLNEPRFEHLKLLGFWLVYFALYFITENLIPVEKCYVVHSWIDDLIPFNEVFVLAYAGWYFLVIWSLWYFGMYNIDHFKKLSKYIIITQIIAMTIYMLFPNMQDLRPAVYPRDNFLTDVVAFIQAFDTNTNVCPSLHVGYSLGIASTWLREKSASVSTKIFVVTAVIIICLSTMFIKQHSVIDFFAAIPMCVFADLVVFRDEWKQTFKKLTKKALD